MHKLNKCRAVKVGPERRVCSHMLVVLEGVQSKNLRGEIVDVNDQPVPGSIIELYESKPDGRLVATFETKDDGRFCVIELPKGNYILRVGWSRTGFNCVDLEVRIKGKSEKDLKITLPTGT
jgi:hypothetical protein